MSRRRKIFLCLTYARALPTWQFRDLQVDVFILSENSEPESTDFDGVVIMFDPKRESPLTLLHRLTRAVLFEKPVVVVAEQRTKIPERIAHYVIHKEPTLREALQLLNSPEKPRTPAPLVFERVSS